MKSNLRTDQCYVAKCHKSKLNRPKSEKDATEVVRYGQIYSEITEKLQAKHMQGQPPTTHFLKRNQAKINESETKTKQEFRERF